MRTPFIFTWLKAALAATLLAVLAGCAIGPRYQRPAVDVPAGFRGDSTNATNSFADLPWWTVFKDDTLQSLIRAALASNYDLRIAVSRVEQARELSAQARSQFFPQLGYLGALSRGKNSSGSNPVFTGGTTSDNFMAAGNASWELDLWGRIRRLNESARAQFLATDEARHDVTASLISEVAQDYLQLLALDQELEIARRATNSFGDSLKIFSQRLQGGVASRLETSSAEALQADAAAALPRIERQIFLQEDQINVLLGRNPGPITRGVTNLDSLVPPIIPAGLPSALLERRPDVRATEQSLRSANASVGVAEADFLPRLSLTVLLGQVSPELSAFTSGGATAWSLAANLTGPIFQGGRLTSQYRQSLAARNQAALEYQSTVLNAFREVSDALESRQKFAEAAAQQARAVTAHNDAVTVATQRYQSGQANYYELLQEQQLLFPAENSLVEARLSQFLAVIQLYRALGGGWNLDKP